MIVESLLALALSQSAVCVPKVETLSLNLGGSTSRAEILRPPIGPPLGIMVLIHGSDVADLDNSVVNENGAIVSTPLKDVAVVMACNGIATIRYDKRFVSGPDSVDRDAFGKATLTDFLSDASAALDAAKARPDLADSPEMAFGWSEGTTVAAALAVQRPTIHTVVLQAPVITSFAQTLPQDYPRVGAPYMRRYATAGTVDADAIRRAGDGPAGMVTRVFIKMFRGFAPGETINPLVDTNHDGRIDIDGEATPVITRWFADGPDGGLGMYASGVALPGVESQLSKIDGKVLIVQGETDGAIDAANAERLRDADLLNLTVFIYPGLGHTLGPSRVPEEDGFLPALQGPLDDMAHWAMRAVTP